MPAPLSTSELVLAARAGDRTAWETLVERFAPLAVTVVRNAGVYGADLADVHQTVWLRAAEHLHSLREPAAFGAGVATTARREAQRVRHHRRHDPIDGWDLPGDDDTATTVETAEETSTLWRTLAALDDRCRQLLVLCAHQIDYRTIAETTGLAVGSIGPSRRRCLDRLRTQLTAPPSTQPPCCPECAP